MISKRIPKRTKGKFGYLADYLAAASEKGEKLDQLWAVNCKAGTDLADLETIKAEIEMTQSGNTRARTDKTYHLLISFGPDRPPPEALRQIEATFAQALGFADHQRVVATHQNTDNFHMHVAINKIHPETLLCHSPSHDYKARDRVCRELEQAYGLTVDKGIEQTQDGHKLHEQAANFEAHRWEQSFLSYAREQKPELDVAKDAAQSWQQLHAAFRERGLQLKASGAGLTIRALPAKDESSGAGKAHRIKASDLGRDYSKTALEAKFGAFQPEEDRSKTPKLHYTRQPSVRARRAYPGLSRQWLRYIAPGTAKRRVNSLKDYFLKMMALSPDAMLLIKAQNDMMNLSVLDLLRVFSGRGGGRPIKLPQEPPNLTQAFLKRMEGGAAPWSQQHRSIDYGQGRPLPYNPVSGKAFEGMNALWLAETGRVDPRWLTAKHIKALGTSIKWGERPTYIEQWSFSTAQTAKDADGKVITDQTGKPVTRRAHLDQPKITHVAMYNAQQLRNRNSLPKTPEPPAAHTTDSPFKQPTQSGNRRAKAILAGSGIELRRDRISGSLYDAATDTMHIRTIKAFKSLGAYHAETLHALCGAVDARLKDKRGPTDTVALNRLRQNIAAHMVCKQLGLQPPTNDAALQADKGALESLKGDERLFYTVCREAETVSRAVMDCEHRQSRDFLLVPFAEAGAARNAGAKFDLIARAFYLPADKPPEAFKRWLKDDPEARVELQVPHAHRDSAKKRGARWDAETKRWYIPVFNTEGVKELNRDRFTRWFDDPKHRIPLNVPYTDREEAKKAGAKWNSETKTWQIPGFSTKAPKAFDHTPFEKWLPKEPAQPEPAKAQTAAQQKTQTPKHSQRKRSIQQDGPEL